MRFVVIVILSLNCFTRVQSESLPGMLIQTVTPHLPGVVNGRRTTDVFFPHSKSVVALVEKGTGGMCTAAIVGSCVLSSGHCSEMKSMRVIAGEDANSPKSNEIIGEIGLDTAKRVVIGDEDASDFVIMKPVRPFPKGYSLPLRMLKRAAYAGQKGASKFSAVGFGYAGTVEKINPKTGQALRDPKTGKIVREDWGRGIRRYGELTYAGVDAKTKMLEYDRSKTGQALTSADSGAPIFEKLPDGSFAIVGVHSSSNKEDVLNDGSYRVEDTTAGYAAPIAGKYNEIMAAFTKLGCEDEETPLQSFVAKHFSSSSDAQKQWDRDAKWQRGPLLEEFRSLLREDLIRRGEISDPGPWRHIRFGIQVEGNSVTISWGAQTSSDRATHDSTLTDWAKAGRSFTVPHGEFSLPLR